MLTLRGRVVNVLRHQARTGRDGKEYPAYAQVQMMVEEPLQDGQKRLGVQTLSIDEPGPFEPLQGLEIQVPIGAYVRNGVLALFLQKGAVPEVIQNQVKGG
jgi:hypothetical protein